MTQQEPTVDGFFDNVGGGGSPSAVLKAVDDFVIGEIVDQRVVDHIPFGETEPDKNKDGSIRKQLVVTLQTDLRNWQGVSKIPLVDKDDASKGTRPPEEDDGKRAVYLPQWSNIQSAVAEATKPHNGGKPGPLRNGGKLGIKVTEHKDTGKGNALKIHAAQYVPPAESAGFFDQSQTAQSAPAPQQQAPATSPAPTPTPAPQQDPWAVGQPTKQPPF